MKRVLRFIWIATRGHRFAPWRSPYIRWRIETYTGLKMDKIGFVEFWGFLWRERIAGLGHRQPQKNHRAIEAQDFAEQQQELLQQDRMGI